MPPNTAILLTPPGAGAIAVIRLAGPAAGPFLQAHFSRPVAQGRCIHGDITDGSRVIDDAVVVACGKQIIDLNVHGGPWVIRAVLELARRNGFDVIETAPPPLPDAALDPGTPLQREVLAHLPLARTETGVRALLAQEQAWADLKAQAARGELERHSIERALADSTMRWLLFPPVVAIIGPANAGKSTLANHLFGQQHSITADLPGTTRDWVGQIANIDGLPVLLVDTPGIRQTDDPIERTAIEHSREQIDAAELKILVLDVTHPLGQDQRVLLDRYPGALRVLNKSDQPATWHAPDGLLISAALGMGLAALRRGIVEFFCGQSPIEFDTPRCWTARQRAILRDALADPAALDRL